MCSRIALEKINVDVIKEVGGWRGTHIDLAARKLTADQKSWSGWPGFLFNSQEFSWL